MTRNQAKKRYRHLKSLTPNLVSFVKKSIIFCFLCFDSNPPQERSFYKEFNGNIFCGGDLCKENPIQRKINSVVVTLWHDQWQVIAWLPFSISSLFLHLNKELINKTTKNLKIIKIELTVLVWFVFHTRPTGKILTIRIIVYILSTFIVLASLFT